MSLTKKQKLARQVLNGDARHICLEGGSRSGKTYLFVRQVILRAVKAPGSRHAIFRFRFNSIKTTVVLDTLPRVMENEFPGLYERSKLSKEDWYLTLPNGSEIWFSGLDDKERVEKVLGAEYATLYFNECSQIPWHSRVTAMSRLAMKTNLRLKAYYDLNPSDKKSWIYRLFHEKRAPDTNQPLPDPLNYAVYRLNPEDNVENLAEEYIDELKAMPERAYKRFYLGQYADVNEGALWTEEILASTRILGTEGLPDWLRVVVAVDPSGTKGPDDTRSDEVGIVVVALGTDQHCYLLEDLSGRYSPEDWSIVVEGAYERHMADRIVGERNYGGDMVRAVIQSRNAELPYSEVTATRGKVQRAEPVAALYEQGKVHHVGHYREIERQLCDMTPAGYTGLRSPDRADAVIWGITELFPSAVKKDTRTWIPPKVQSRGHSARAFRR